MGRESTRHELVLPAPQVVRRALGPEGIRAELVLTRFDGEPLTATEERLARAVMALVDAEHEVSLAQPLDETPLPPVRRGKRP
jgi:hypothetical protein